MNNEIRGYGIGIRLENVQDVSIGYHNYETNEYVGNVISGNELAIEIDPMGMQQSSNIQIVGNTIMDNLYELTLTDAVDVFAGNEVIDTNPEDNPVNVNNFDERSGVFPRVNGP